MTAHPNPRQAFRQFQYLTVPLHLAPTHVKAEFDAARDRQRARR